MGKITKFKKEVVEIIKNGTKEQRIYICGQKFAYFAISYFGRYFTYPVAPFHWEMFDDVERLVYSSPEEIAQKLEEIAWIIFRESAKTSLAKIFVLWCICYKKKNYIAYDSYDKSNAEAALFDIVVELQTNSALIRDFGNLFYRKRHKEFLEEASRKRIGEFITENKIKVEAFSTQESTRGRLYNNIRPDLFVLDDIENDKTKDSYPIISKIISHIDELKAGIGVNGSVLYLGNLITSEGVISYVMESCKNNPKAIVRNIPVMDKKTGELAWPGKFVLTNAEAIEINATIEDPLKRKVSIEAKKSTLNAGGKKVFEKEMMNDPETAGELVFDRDIINIKLDKTKDPDKVVAGVKYWGSYNPRHRYGIGGDTSEGIGRDAQALVLIDFSTTPPRVIATFKDNQMDPATFGHVMAKVGNEFGGCVLAPEVNNTGYATVAELNGSDLGYRNIYVRKVMDKVSKQEVDAFGWKSTGGNRWTIISSFVDAVENGEIEILDESLLLECKYFKKRDVSVLKLQDGMTRHFDKLIAAAIAWEMRKHSIQADPASIKSDPKNSIYFRNKK